MISAQGLKVKIKYFIVETGLRTPKYPVPRFSNLSHDSSSEHKLASSGEYKLGHSRIKVNRTLSEDDNET